MINLCDAQITDSLPQIIGNQPWAKAISYATQRMIQRLLVMADATRTFSKVDLLEDAVLDVLAIDLRVANYDQRYSVEIKRRIVKYALQFWATAGTKAATEGVVTKIFGDTASVTEWFDYGGNPGYFKVLITDSTLTDADVLEFERVAENVKRLSAWLDKIVFEVTETMKIYMGIIECELTGETIKQQRDGNEFHGFIPHIGDVEKYKMEVD